MKLILDAGGVLVYPAMGGWQFSVGMMNSPIAKTLNTDVYRRAHELGREYLREDVRIDTYEEEFAIRRKYFEHMNAHMDWALSASELDALAWDFVRNVRRMGLYTDLHEYLPKWRDTYGLGLLSDTMPSLQLVLETAGVWTFFDAHVFSTDVGALKPDPRMYARIATLMKADPCECLFVDDLEKNLRGAIAAGMQGVQMARDENAIRWDGPVVENLAELDSYVKSLC